MIKIKKYNESGDSIVEVIEFDTIEECIAYREYNDTQEHGELESTAPSFNAVIPSASNIILNDGVRLNIINNCPDLVDFGIERVDNSISIEVSDSFFTNK